MKCSHDSIRWICLARRLVLGLQKMATNTKRIALLGIVPSKKVYYISFIEAFTKMRQFDSEMNHTIHAIRRYKNLSFIFCIKLPARLGNCSVSTMGNGRRIGSLVFSISISWITNQCPRSQKMLMSNQGEACQAGNAQSCLTVRIRKVFSRKIAA